MAKSPYRPFKPKHEQMVLVPETSGNTINGVGEEGFRRASPIYWHDPDTLVHGDLQKWFYTQDPDNVAIAKAREAREKFLDIEVPPVSSEPLDQSAEAWTSDLRAFAATLDMELFGITALQEKWLFERHNLSQKWIIMIGVAHDYDQIKHAPEDLAGAEVIRQYGRGTKAAKDIATWIRERGRDAVPHGGPMAGSLLLIPPAIECGFGELGKHGSIINREFGSSFRLACVLTDIPLVATEKETYGVDDFCSRCQVCANECPPEAILPEKNWVRGEQKWYVDFDKCIPFFNENYGCAICIAVCPWSIPGRGPRIVEQLARRAARNKQQ
ncbi:MAG: 4Fe-4S dicluster domain-containing protein [Gammaproteobacteria bacterium]|nr:MAG: 4Fe-4S dicluster domain-containing protein [Gammaproteobacteria bacterium]